MIPVLTWYLRVEYKQEQVFAQPLTRTLCSSDGRKELGRNTVVLGTPPLGSLYQ